MMARTALAVGLVLGGWSPARAAGALAIGPCGAYGSAYDFAAMSRARAQALASCRGKKCHIVATLRHGCAAFAVDAAKMCGALGYGTAPRLGQAQNVAIRQCYRYGGKICVIRAWVCDARG